jgi:hypothetical protein
MRNSGYEAWPDRATPECCEAWTDHCYWQFGSDTPNETSDFGQNAQYGRLLQQDYTNPGGSTGVFYEDFRNVINNPC